MHHFCLFRLMQASCDVAFKYAHDREAFGSKIGHYQVSTFSISYHILRFSALKIRLFIKTSEWIGPISHNSCILLFLIILRWKNWSQFFHTWSNVKIQNLWILYRWFRRRWQICTQLYVRVDHMSTMLLGHWMLGR